MRNNNDLVRGLPGPENILRKRFSNGVTVLIHEDPRSSTAAVCGSLPAGYGLDELEKPGVSAFVSSALMAGTRTRTFEQISDFLESIGAVLSFTTDPEAICFNGNCLCEDLPDLLALLKEILDEPAFPEDYLEVLRLRALSGYDEDEDDGAFMAFKGILWGYEHPYGRLKDGIDREIRAITRDDLVNFHKRFFGPKDLIISLSGGFRGQEIMNRCEELFGSWEKTQEEVDEDELFPEFFRDDGCACIRMHMDVPHRKEVSLVMGTCGPAGGDPDLLPFILGNSIFGGYELTDRIGRVVREKHGLAYSVFSALTLWKRGGCWSVIAGVDPADLVKAGELIRAEIRRFTAEPVSPQELEDAKSRYIAGLPLHFHDNSETATMIHALAYFHRDPDHWRRIPERISRITPESLLETVKKWIDPDKLVIVSAGPRDEGNKDRFWWPPV